MWRILLLLLAPLAAVAQDDPLKSPACGEALVRLQAAREARSPQVEALRAAATSTCLGGATQPAPRSNRWAQPPLAVPAPVIEPPAPPQAAAQPRPVPPPVQVDRPAAISSCDANGCWTSDGARLNRAGPQLIGPGGACTVQGAVAWCP